MVFVSYSALSIVVHRLEKSIYFLLLPNIMHKFYFMRHAMQERKSLTLSTFCFPKISENFSCSFCLKSKREKLGNPGITAYMHEIPRKKRTANEVLYLHNSDFRKKSGVFYFPFFFLFLQNVELSRYFLNEDLL